MGSKKILYIVTNSDLGGVSKYLLEIIKFLPKDLEPYFIMAAPGYLSDELEKIGINKDNMFYVPMTNSIFDIKTHITANKKTLEIIKQIKPDIIHCNATTAAIVGAICGSITKIPTVYTVHGWPFTSGLVLWKQIFYRILEFFMCAVYKKIICVSEYDRQIGVKALPMYKNKMVTVHNGISDIPDDLKKCDFSNDELKIVMIARFCPQKDPYTLISAVNEVNKEGLNVKLDLFGYGPELDRVKEFIESKNNKNIRYMGEISDVAPILKNYDVYSLISIYEGLPIGIIEGMRAGLPVLVSDVGGNSECIKDNGYLVYRQDVDDCAEKIKLLWNNYNNISQLGQNSRKIFEDEFLVNKMVNKTLEVFKEC